MDELENPVPGGLSDFNWRGTASHKFAGALALGGPLSAQHPIFPRREVPGKVFNHSL